METIPITVNGAKVLEDELLRLKDDERPRIVNDIATAREHGDLKENAEYHAAREQQSFNEGRILEIEGKLGNAQVIDISKVTPGERVIFGTTVRLLGLKEEEEIKYKIVGEDEADLKDQKISVMSPIARAIVGKSVGDIVTVATPSGANEYEIIEVSYSAS